MNAFKVHLRLMGAVGAPADGVTVLPFHRRLNDSIGVGEGIEALAPVVECSEHEAGRAYLLAVEFAMRNLVVGQLAGETRKAFEFQDAAAVVTREGNAVFPVVVVDRSGYEAETAVDVECAPYFVGYGGILSAGADGLATVCLMAVVFKGHPHDAVVVCFRKVGVLTDGHRHEAVGVDGLAVG